MRLPAKIFALLLAWASTLILTAATFFWFAAGEIYDYQDSFKQESGSSVDVVLCLAGAKRRIPVAFELWNQIRAQKGVKPPVLFFSGVGPLANVHTLIEQGVPAEAIKGLKPDELIIENVSENTFENAQVFASFARQNRWRRVLLVTSDYHMRRAEFILRKVLEPGTEILLSTVDAEHFGRNEWHQNAYAIRVTLIEYIKWLYYRYTY